MAPTRTPMLGDVTLYQNNCSLAVSWAEPDFASLMGASSIEIYKLLVITKIYSTGILSADLNGVTSNIIVEVEVSGSSTSTVIDWLPCGESASVQYAICTLKGCSGFGTSTFKTLIGLFTIWQ